MRHQQRISLWAKRERLGKPDEKIARNKSQRAQERAADDANPALVYTTCYVEVRKWCHCFCDPSA
jgi:hypothetical protein